MVARIKGTVSETTLRDAVTQVQRRHALLRVRIEEDNDNQPWFTSEGTQEIPIEVIPRESDDDWLQVHQRASEVPFEFGERPAIRFILVQSPAQSDLIILCHHIICDGLSLAYLARDVMVHLGDPGLEAQVLPAPAPIDVDNMPEGVSLNPLVRFLVKRINARWQKAKLFFDRQDYRDLNQAYWSNYVHQLLPVEFSEAQTAALVNRCRQEKVTVNSALTAAFVGAQAAIQDERHYDSSFGVGVSLRERLPNPAGEGMGFYATAVTPKARYDLGAGFWENARSFHRKIRPLLENKTLFQEPRLWCELDPSILEALNFKRLGGLVSPDAASYHKLSAFSRQEDTVSSLLKRQKMDSLDKIVMGTAMTNLTRMDFPRQYGALKLDRLIMNPGGAFPLATVNLVVGAVTCSGKLSLILEYAEQNAGAHAMGQVRDQALEFLLQP
jgi:NRPS condensation-like uncharacterized protein